MAASSGSIVLLDAACCCVRFCERILKALPSIFTADQPMMSAAATIIIQAGEICASHTPKGEVSAPPRPAATPSDTMHVLWRIWDAAPDMDVGIMVNSDVAVETTGLMPNAKRKMGTMTVPPPMPSNPDKIPIATPAIAGSTNIASTSIV